MFRTHPSAEGWRRAHGPRLSRELPSPAVSSRRRDARVGLTAALVLLELVITSIRRAALGFNYGEWQLMHNHFSVGIIGFAPCHLPNANDCTCVPLQSWQILGLAWCAGR